MRGFELERELSAEFSKNGTSGYPIVVIDEEGNTFLIKKVTTDHHTDADGSYPTWICVERN